jgi:hypothetical protein
VTILTAGASLGFLAVVLIGAAVGAVTSGLLAVAGNLWNNREWDTGVAHAVLVGAITGAVGGGIGAGVGMAFKGASLAVQYGAAMVTAGVLDAAGQFVMGGFSFKKFSWANLGITLVVTALTLGLAHSVSGPKAPTAPAAGEGGRPPVEPAARPGEPVTPAEPATRPVEPAAEPAAHPAEPAAAHPTEPATAPAEPTAAAKPGEPAAAPAEPAAAKPAEPAAAPAEPAAPKPAEPAPAPTEPTARAAEPAAEPTKAAPSEAPPAEPGKVATTPEERATMESTAGKGGKELTPSEIKTERAVASRTKGEPINEPPFTSEHELPNGHKVKETPEGEICERCSTGGCGTYDADGNPIPRPEGATPPTETPGATPKEAAAAAPTDETPVTAPEKESTAPKVEGETTEPPVVPAEEPKPSTVWAHMSDGRIIEFQPGEIPGNPVHGDIVDIPGTGRGRVVGLGEPPNAIDVLEPPPPRAKGAAPPVTADRDPALNWGDPTSKPTYGHTFEGHGQGSKVTTALTGEAGGTGQAQGQWLDNQAAADFLNTQRQGLTTGTDVDIPPGLGQVIMPDGTIVPVTRARLVPSRTGGFKTAFPILK